MECMYLYLHVFVVPFQSMGAIKCNNSSFFNLFYFVFVNFREEKQS